jgi:hypothetical protein
LVVIVIVVIVVAFTVVVCGESAHYVPQFAVASDFDPLCRHSLKSLPLPVVAVDSCIARCLHPLYTRPLIVVLRLSHVLPRASSGVIAGSLGGRSKLQRGASNRSAAKRASMTKAVSSEMSLGSLTGDVSGVCSLVCARESVSPCPQFVSV